MRPISVRALARRPGVLCVGMLAGALLTLGVLLSRLEAQEYDVYDTPAPVTEEHCPAATLLPPKLQVEVLRAHPAVDLRLLGVYLTCAFDPHDEGDHHAVLYDHFPSPDAGALWTTWATGRLPTAFALHPDCPATSTRGTACAHFLHHPGPHTWEPRTLPDAPPTS